METTKLGWKYISAIFQVILDKSEERDSLIEPQYIFRGITKRWFTTSTLIKRYQDDIINEMRDILENDKDNMCDKNLKNYIKQKKLKSLKNDPKLFEFLYGFCYLRYKSTIEREEEKLGKEKSVHDKQIKFLKRIMASANPYNNKSKPTDYDYCVPEFINSGAVVRLKNKESKHPSNLDYINYIKHMLNDLKIRFPEYNNKSISDTEVLADIQHKGAATCLADFSYNFLTSLWFATESFNDDIGYLFCYDINKALIQDDQLFILNKNYVNRSIEDLLYETSKRTKFTGKKSYRYWLWRPSVLNERIAIQDSVFIFGLEPFRISDNDIIAIPIPPNWKKPIQQVLKSFFGMSAESIYCDAEGYADANSKTKPYYKAFKHFYNEKYGKNSDFKPIKDSKLREKSAEGYLDFLQCGMDCLFQGEYALALDYLTLFKTKMGNDYNNIEYGTEGFYILLKDYALSTDISYSKGLCLKHLDNEDGAIYELKKAYEKCKRLNDDLARWINASDGKDNGILQSYQRYIESKQSKVYNDLMDMYFITHQYDELNNHFIEMIKEKSIKMINGKDQNEMIKTEEVFENLEKDNKSLYLFYLLKLKEAKCCQALERFINNNTSIVQNLDFEQYSDDKDKQIIVDLEKLGYTYVKKDQPLLFVLNKYFACVVNAIERIKSDDKSSKTAYSCARKSFDNARKHFYNKTDDEFGHTDDLFTSWDLKNIEFFIQEIKNSHRKDIYKELKQLTDQMNNVIFYVQSKTKFELS